MLATNVFQIIYISTQKTYFGHTTYQEKFPRRHVCVYQNQTRRENLKFSGFKLTLQLQLWYWLLQFIH